MFVCCNLVTLRVVQDSLTTDVIIGIWLHFDALKDIDKNLARILSDIAIPNLLN